MDRYISAWDASVPPGTCLGFGFRIESDVIPSARMMFFQDDFFPKGRNEDSTLDPEAVVSMTRNQSSPDYKPDEDFKGTFLVPKRQRNPDVPWWQISIVADIEHDLEPRGVTALLWVWVDEEADAFPIPIRRKQIKTERIRIRDGSYFRRSWDEEEAEEMLPTAIPGENPSCTAWTALAFTSLLK